MSKGGCGKATDCAMLRRPGETESGSAGTQPDKGYSGLRCAKGAPGPWPLQAARGLFFIPCLDIGDMPYKIHPCNPLLRINFQPRTLQSDEPGLVPGVIVLQHLRCSFAAKSSPISPAFPPELRHLSQSQEKPPR